MAQTGTQGMSATQKEELWRRRRQGKSINDISRAIGSFGHQFLVSLWRAMVAFHRRFADALRVS